MKGGVGGKGGRADDWLLVLKMRTLWSKAGKLGKEVQGRPSVGERRGERWMSEEDFVS